MTFPTTRDEYRQRLMHDIFRLVQMIEADDNFHCGAEALARGVHFDVREYFHAQRWQPIPVYEGIQAHVPLNEPLTLLMVHYAGEGGRRFIQGKIVNIQSPPRPGDGAGFEIVPKDCRLPRRFHYRVGEEAALTVWRGFVSESLMPGTPLYHHETLPPIRYDAAQ